MDQEETTPLLNPNPKHEISSTLEDDEKPSQNFRLVRTKVPEVELHIYSQGKGPIAVSKSTLGGWDQDQLEVRDILEKYGFKSIYAFNPHDGGRTVPIRFHSKNGRSMLPYKDGSVILIDGEPKVLEVVQTLEGQVGYFKDHYILFE
ncbi:Zinc transporter ZIP4 [Bienertia sinuspersici]